MCCARSKTSPSSASTVMTCWAGDDAGEIRADEEAEASLELEAAGLVLEEVPGRILLGFASGTSVGWRKQGK